MIALHEKAWPKMRPAETLDNRAFDARHVSIGAALCYLRFRFAAEHPFQDRLGIEDWHRTFCQRPSVAATEFRDDERPTG